jgi:phosphoribosylglycinamide formyltransferase 2
MSVTLGTPLQSSAFKVLLLGSGELGKEVVISLQRLGVEVHAADRYDHAPAMQVAHYSYTLNMADATELKQLIEKIKPNLIVPEITLLTVRAKNPQTGEIETHFCDPIGHRQDAGDYVESWQPQAITVAALEESKRIAHKVTVALGGCGIFGVELFIKGDKVWFSEVSPRPHDTGLVTLASQFQSEFELHARAILGLPVNTARHSVAASAVIYAGVDANNLSFSGVNLALTNPNTDLRLFGKPEGFKRRRMGVATARAETTDLARELAKNAADQVSVNTNA